MREIFRADLWRMLKKAIDGQGYYMVFDIHTALPELIPFAVAWAEAQQERIRCIGQSLDDAGLVLAEHTGVSRPDLIRIAFVSSIPVPDHPKLREAALAISLIGPGTIGMTFGYGIYLLRGHATSRLLSHEFRHVYQYEKAGSITTFLHTYLEQIARFGYAQAPLEIDARQHEIE